MPPRPLLPPGNETLRPQPGSAARPSPGVWPCRLAVGLRRTRDAREQHGGALVAGPGGGGSAEASGEVEDSQTTGVTEEEASAQQCIAPGANRPTVLHLTNGRRSRKDCQGVQGAGGASGAPSPGADPLPGLAGCMTE
ncbi:uncharacterized protein LOC142364117 isoform X1 [Opisthocomus hoazin]|uniref:uncharacterized protein LOC142364117 isoform X1 n=1 Tax=Opisthocomus hoazin TaxID=30419 RepID=UPI003F539255